MSKNTENKFSFFHKEGTIAIWLDEGAKAEVKYAVDDLISDIQKITGKRLCLVKVPPKNNAILIQTKPVAFDYAWENYRVKSQPNNILQICGSDSRGTMFGIYSFIKNYLNVDPYYHWTQKEPERQNDLYWQNVNIDGDTPDFKFRGWFINDEDFLTGWQDGGCRLVRHPIFNFISRTIHLDVIKKVVETALRDGFNLMLPSSYTSIFNYDEKVLMDEVSRRGLFLTMHHCETMGVSSFTYDNYWKQRGQHKEFSYLKEREAITEVWREAIAKWKEYPNVIWQLGFRCGGDMPMDEPGTGTEQKQGELLSTIIADQHEFLKKELGKEPDYMAITLWAEGAYLNQKGYLQLPEGAILIFSDNCAGFKMQPDFYSTPRSKNYKYGIYYHQGIIWGTHLTPCVSPEITKQVLVEACEKQSTDYIMVNVANIREFTFGISATAEITNDINGFSPEVHLEYWVSTYFSTQVDEITALYKSYFNAFVVHPERKIPMFMDNLIWSTGYYYLHCLEIKEYANPLLLVNLKTDNPFRKSQLDMYPQIQDHDLYRKALAKQNAEMERIYTEGMGIIKKLPPKEQGFLFDMLIYYSGVLTFTGKWLHHLGSAFTPASENDYNSTLVSLDNALNELRKFFALTQNYRKGPFKHWYRNSKSVNYQQALEQHIKVIEQYKELAAAVQ
jgi:hypothetical protein